MGSTRDGTGPIPFHMRKKYFIITTNITFNIFKYKTIIL